MVFRGGEATGHAQLGSQLDNILDVREHDVPYHVRVAIDAKINVGHWYTVRGRGSDPPEIKLVEDEPDRPVSYIHSCVSYCHSPIPMFSYPGTSGVSV